MTLMNNAGRSMPGTGPLGPMTDINWNLLAEFGVRGVGSVCIEHVEHSV